MRSVRASGNALRMPVPLGETLRLWRHARNPDARQMLRRSLRAFLVWSGLVLAAVLIPSGTWWIVRARSANDRQPTRSSTSSFSAFRGC